MHHLGKSQRFNGIAFRIDMQLLYEILRSKSGNRQRDRRQWQCGTDNWAQVAFFYEM